MSLRKRYHGIFNCRDSAWQEQAAELLGSIVLLDGKEIKEVWYVDTEAGIVKTQDVFGDGKPHVNHWPKTWGPEDFPGREVDCPIDGIVSETLRGKVELYGPVIESPEDRRVAP